MSLSYATSLMPRATQVWAGPPASKMFGDLKPDFEKAAAGSPLRQIKPKDGRERALSPNDLVRAQTRRHRPFRNVRTDPRLGASQ